MFTMIDVAANDIHNYFATLRNFPDMIFVSLISEFVNTYINIICTLLSCFFRSSFFSCCSYFCSSFVKDNKWIVRKKISKVELFIQFQLRVAQVWIVKRVYRINKNKKKRHWKKRKRSHKMQI